MARRGEINIDQVKATYQFDDIHFVDSRKLNFANEVRLYYEISFGIGLVLVGNSISNFNWYICISAIIFLFFGIFNLVRYIKKSKELVEGETNITILEIIKAQYGTPPDKIEIVTEIIKNKVENGMIPKQMVTNQNVANGKDPNPRTHKILIIDYTLNGELKTKTFKEHTEFELP